ncbi:MAG: ABC transporter substrate-binding protein, partial [Lachnospiraceae bacterium]|nr:ABC transporter substrate-binding protein [Lachnospiraceae bacterium]
MKKTLTALLLTGVLALASLTVGCSADKASTETPVDSTEVSTEAGIESKSDESKPAEKLKLNVGFTAGGMTSIVDRYALDKGLYEAEGLDLTITDWSSIQEVLALISRGELDIADGDPSSYIPAIDGGIPAKLVGNMWRYKGCYWLIGNNSINGIEDLKGKTVGTAGASGGMRLSVLKMLESKGISPEEVELVANGAGQAAYATLTVGEVDATIIHNPFAALAEANGDGKILGRAWDYIPDYYTGTIIASDKIINDDPEKLQRFITAYYKVHEEVKNEYFDEFIDWAADYMNTEPALLKEAVEAEIDVWSDYPVIPEDRLQKTVEYLQQYG